jgi:hypothetical protein
MNLKVKDFEDLRGNKVEFMGHEMYVVASSQEIVVLATSDLKDDARMIFADILIEWEYAVEEQLSELGYYNEESIYENFLLDACWIQIDDINITDDDDNSGE